MEVNKAEYIVRKIEKISGKPIENRVLFLRYVCESLSTKKLVTFYNWECPPRKLSLTEKGIPYIDYNVDLEKIFQGQKVDEYTEIPRVVESARTEISVLAFLKSLGFKFRFVKIIADTNVYYLTPESLGIIGKKVILDKFNEFKKRIESAAIGYPCKTTVLLFKEALGNLRSDYERVFQTSYQLLSEKAGSLVPDTIIEEQFERTRKHIGISDKDWVTDFSFRTIATYAAEGFVFDQMSKTKEFSNCVWLNNHEIDTRTVEITNCYRRKENLGDLPMVFWSG